MKYEGDWAERLSSAIIVKAANDYRRLARLILAGKSSPRHVDELEKIHGFFHSEYFRELTNLDGDVLEKKLAEEVMDEFDGISGTA